MASYPFADFFMVAIVYKGKPSHFATDANHHTAMFDTEERAVESMKKEYYDDAEYIIIHYTGKMGEIRKNEGGVKWE